MDFSIASREGYAIVTDNENGRSLLTVPWKNGQTMCFTVLSEHEDYEEAALIAMAFGQEGITPMDHMPEEVRNLADNTATQARSEEGDRAEDEPLALAAAAEAE